MGLHIASGNDIPSGIDLVDPIQAAVRHGGCTISKTASANVSGSGQICHLCIGFLYIIFFNVCYLRIVLLKCKSITITVGFGGCSGIVCFFGMGCIVYVVDSNCICVPIIFCRRNHIARFVDSDFSNIGRFTQYAASCE